MKLTITRVGCLRLLLKATPDVIAMTARERSRFVIERISALIEASPISTAKLEEVPGEADAWESDFEAAAEDGWVPVRLAGRFRFKAHWPGKNQETFDWAPRGDDCFEDFEINYDGFIYTITAECKGPIPRPYNFYFGREGHRILNALIARSEAWKTEIIGPTPMFPVFYIASGVNDPGTFSLGRDLIRTGDTLENLVILDANTKLDARHVIHHVMLPAQLHYAALLARAKLRLVHSRLYDHFNDAQHAYLRNRSGYRAWLPTVGAPPAIGDAYSTYVDFEHQRAQTAEAARQADELFARNAVLQPFGSYTSDQVEDATATDVSHVMEGLRFLTDESRSRGISTATWIAPLAAGIIALGGTTLALMLAPEPSIEVRVIAPTQTVEPSAAERTATP